MSGPNIENYCFGFFFKTELKYFFLFKFQIVFPCKQLYQRNSYICFPSKLSFRFPFSFFRSVLRFSNTRLFAYQ